MVGYPSTKGMMTDYKADEAEKEELERMKAEIAKNWKVFSTFLK